MSNNFLSLGQMSSPADYTGGRCPHIPFFIGGGGQMSEGGNALHSLFYLDNISKLSHNGR